MTSYQLPKAERRAMRLAGDALRCALVDDWTLATRTVQRISDECGSAGVARAILGWSDTLIARTPGLHGNAVRLAFMNADSGEVGGADDVPEEVRWAGRVLAARAADDEDAWNALMDALPDDPAATGRHVARLLHLVALNLRNLGVTGGVA